MTGQNNFAFFVNTNKHRIFYCTNVSLGEPNFQAILSLVDRLVRMKEKYCINFPAIPGLIFLQRIHFVTAHNLYDRIPMALCTLSKWTYLYDWSQLVMAALGLSPTSSGHHSSISRQMFERSSSPVTPHSIDDRSPSVTSQLHSVKKKMTSLPRHSGNSCSSNTQTTPKIVSNRSQFHKHILAYHDYLLHDEITIFYWIFQVTWLAASNQCA